MADAISLKKYAEAASEQFEKSEERLSEIEGGVREKMGGKSTGKLTGALFGTIVWLAVLSAFSLYIINNVSTVLGLVCLGFSLVLIIAMYISEVTELSYYSKISSCRRNIAQLKERISIGKSSIPSNLDEFMSSRAKGWHYPLSAGSSIPGEIADIEKSLANMESLKEGFIHKLKNFFFFAVVILVAGVGAFALLDRADEILYDFIDDYIRGDVWTILHIAGLIAVEVGIIILAKKWWSHTDCSVNNITLFVILPGPFLILLLALVAGLAAAAIAIVLGLLAVVFGLACVCGSFAGG